MGRVLILVGMMLLVIAVTAAAPTKDSATPIQTNLLFLTASEVTINLNVDCYPQALPNDGRSEAEICVTVTDGAQPIPDKLVTAEVTGGDGILFIQEAVTDSEGIALFPYRAGFIPEKSQLSFHVAEADTAAILDIPLAPVTYLDVTLVTPEEYLAYLNRQVAAAPIYTLQADVFPDQLAADGGSFATIWVDLNHVEGSAAAGVPLTAEIISGEGTLESRNAVTNLEGSVELHYIAGMTPGTVTIQVSEPSTGLTTAVDILLVQAGPARVQLYYADPIAGGVSRDGAILPADGFSGLPVIAEVTDLMGIPLSGIELELSILDEGNGWLEVMDNVSDIEGRVSFIYHAGSSTGRVRLRAFIADGMDYDSPGF